MDNNDVVTKKDLGELEARFDAKLDGVVDRLTESIRDIETKLLTAFHQYGEGQVLETHRGPGAY